MLKIPVIRLTISGSNGGADNGDGEERLKAGLEFGRPDYGVRVARHDG
jgi:hypothetical protein